MSWGIEHTGTPAAVKAAVTADCDRIAEGYKTSAPEEAKDILAAKELILSHIDALLIDREANAVNVKASGSHSTASGKLYSATCTFQVTRISLKL